MSKHRNPDCKVTNKLCADNNVTFDPYRRFQPGEALEMLRGEVVGLEAFAFAAYQALERVTCAAGLEEQREFDRLRTYVSKTAAVAVAVADLGDRLVAELGRPTPRDAAP